MNDKPRCPVTGKVCYTRAEAKAARQSIQRVRVGRMSKYRCPDAHLHPDRPWHVGHTPAPGRKRHRVIGPIGE